MSKLTLIHDEQSDQYALENGTYVLVFRFSHELDIEEFYFVDMILNQTTHIKWWTLVFNLDKSANGFQVILPNKKYYDTHHKRIHARINGKMFSINKRLQENRDRHALMQRIIAENPPIDIVKETNDNNFIEIIRPARNVED